MITEQTFAALTHRVSRKAAIRASVLTAALVLPSTALAARPNPVNETGKPHVTKPNPVNETGKRMNPVNETRQSY